jgi:integrase
MDAKLTKTSTPGIYRRHSKSCGRAPRCSCSYVVVYAGKASTFSTLEEAREGKRLAQHAAKLSRAHARGLHRDEFRAECQDCAHEEALRSDSQPTLREYAARWIEEYHGVGRRGFREETRDEYRKLLYSRVLEFFPPDARLVDIRPADVAAYIAWLAKQPSRRGGTLADGSIRNALAPLRACLATARRDGLITNNPCADAVLPYRARIEEDEDRPRPFPDETMELTVSLIPPRYRLLFELLAATGVRRSELFGLQVRHLELNGGRPYVRIRQRIRRQRERGLQVGPLKSRHARRDLPIPMALADKLREQVGRRADDEFVFRSLAGGPLDADNIFERVLAPACAEAGVSWAGFHTFRHTVASRMFASGRNAKQVQHWLGHHAASFTLDTYVHLLEGDLGEPLEPRTVKIEDDAPSSLAHFAA